MIPALLFWPLLAVLTAFVQAVLMPAIKRTMPGSEAKRQAFALHIVGTAVYLVPLLLAPAGWVVALLARALFFDPVLQLTQGLPVFGVGYTAASDRLLRWAAPAHPERARAGIWAATVLAAAAWLLR